MSVSTQTLSVPAHIDPVVDVSGMSLADCDAQSSESAVESILARANYILAVAGLTVYNRVSGGESSADIIPDLARDETTGKQRNRQYVSRLSLIGYAVSHGVTDAIAFRTAMGGKKVDDVKALINEHIDDEGLDETGLIDSLTTEPKTPKPERTEQESFHNRIKSATQTFGAAVAQFTAEGAEVELTEELRAMLAVITEGVATLTA